MDIRTNTATRITVGPFFDKTDGVTPEVALTVTAEKLTLMCDVAGVPTLILDAAPTASGGANDMVHVTGDDAGYYDLELAAANVNYMGRAKIAITDATTHCPVFHELHIISAEEYDRRYGDATFLGIKEYGVPTAATANTVTLQAGHVFGTNTLGGNTLFIKGATQGYWQEMQILSNTNADPCVLTMTDNFTVTPSGALMSKIFGTAAGSTANPPLVKLAPITHTSAVIPTVSAVSGAVGSVTGAVGSVTGSVGSVTGAVGSVTGSVASVAGAVGSVTGNVGGNVVGSVASVTALAANSVSAAALATDAVTEIVNGVWNELKSAHTTANTYGAYLDAAISGVSTGGVSAATIAAAVWDLTTTGHVTAGTFGEQLKTDVDAILAAAPPSSTVIRDAIFARVFDATKMAGMTFEEIIGLSACVMLGEVSGLPTAPVFRNLGDTANAVSAVTDVNGNRMSVTPTLTSVR